MADRSVSDPGPDGGSPGVVLLVTKDELGQGPAELGWVLMRSFFKALARNESKPARAIFVNTGVRLTTEGSGVLDDLRALESAEVQILSCGTCLDYFGLKGKLEVGEETNMNDTVAALMTADRVVCP
jgi:selenium metabolism protein YedF